MAFKDIPQPWKGLYFVLLFVAVAATIVSILMGTGVIQVPCVNQTGCASDQMPDGKGGCGPHMSIG
jgi:hypothetical protein